VIESAAAVAGGGVGYHSGMRHLTASLNQMKSAVPFRSPALRPEPEPDSQPEFYLKTKKSRANVNQSEETQRGGEAEEDQSFNELMRRYGSARNENEEKEGEGRDGGGRARMDDQWKQQISLRSSRSAPAAPGGAGLFLGSRGEATGESGQSEDSDEDDSVAGGIFHLTSPTKRDS
jgi:hypothetical protein